MNLTVSPCAVALAFAICLTVPRSAAAQEPGGGRGAGTVRGVVRSSLGEPVPYAVVAMPPRFTQRFTDGAGAFVVTGVPAGTYHLQVRQVGYKPVDTTVAVAAGQTIALTVTLERLTVQLEDITVVTARGGGCTEPGPPDAGSPELVALFEQLEQYARQYRLLATAYQFRYRLVRTFEDLNDLGAVDWSRSDTAEYLSSSIVHYRQGDVVVMSDEPDGSRTPVVVLPTVADLADDGFQASHCFSYSGRVQVAGGELVRFHFRPPDSLQAPDLAGDVDMDPRTYQVRRVYVTLTHPEHAWDKMRAANSTITFDELLPNIVVQRRVESVQVLVKPALRIAGLHYVAQFVEHQELLDTHFLHPLPGGASPP